MASFFDDLDAVGDHLLHEHAVDAGADAVIAKAAKARKPVLTCWMGDESVQASRELFREHGVPTYGSLEAAVEAFAAAADLERAIAINDLDEFEIMAKVSNAVREGQLIIYHAWENYQFRDGVGYQSLIPSPLNPVQ